MKKIFVSALTAFCFVGIWADEVEEVEFEGLDRVEDAAIQDCIKIKPHQKYSQADIDDSLKALFKKDFFSYIKFIKRGNKLVVQCTEKPMIDQVAFEGNDAASDEMLKHIVNDRIGEGKLYSRYIVKDILADMQMAYKALGYFSVSIVPKIIKHPGNKIDLVFEINEGSKTTVKKIIFIGNKSFDDDELKDLLTIKESQTWRFWDRDSEIYREDKVNVDIDNLTRFYKNNGYPFFVVLSTAAELDYDKKSHYCTFTVEEGDKYSIGKVSIDSEIEKIPADQFVKFIDLKKDSVYNEELIYAVRDCVRREVALQDNPFIDVAVDIDYDRANKIANVNYKIVKTPHAFIERIEIVGNTKTLDRVIRREFTVHEGDAFNVYKVQQTVERLKGMDYFDDVQISDEPGSTEDQKFLIVKIKEKESSAQIRFGLSVCDADGFGGFIGLTENNLYGTGRLFSTEVYWAQKLYGAKASIYDPRFMDKSFGAGLSVGANNYDRKKYNDTVLRSVFISPFIRYAISPNLSHKIAYYLSYNSRKWWNRKENKLHDKVPDYVNDTPVMKDEYGSYVCSEISSVLYYDQTDNPYDPRKGYGISLTNAYAGIGGAVRYFKNELEGTYYRPLTKKITFIANAKIGHIHEIRNTRSMHRYALGGDGYDLRGFDSYGVGPRDINGNSVGGNKFWTMSFMAKAPLSTREMGIDGFAFWDFGSAWGTKYPGHLVRDSAGFRSSVGFGIAWRKSPFGMPMSFIFGFPIKKREHDEKQIFTLSGLMM